MKEIQMCVRKQGSEFENINFILIYFDKFIL